MHVVATQNSPVYEVILSLTRKGQVTIPIAARRVLGLQNEKKVALLIDEQEKIVRLEIPRYPTVSSLAGAAGKLKQDIPLQEMLDTARTEALARKTQAPHGRTLS